MNTINYREISQDLKKRMRVKGITYPALAKQLQMSVSGVKKIFSAKDVSILRLNSICEALEISLSDIIQSIEKKEMVEVAFTKEQESFFVRHMNCFYFYWKLVYERKSVEEISQEFKLSRKDIDAYLKALHEHKLLRLMPNKTVKIAPIQRVYWVGKGPLVEKVYQKFALQMMLDLAKPNLSNDELFIIRYFKAKPSTVNELKLALKKLEEEFFYRAIREMRTSAKNLKDVRWISALDLKSFVSSLDN